MSAQTMYRCGNVYQDRACDAGQAGKVVNTTGAGAPAAARPGANVDCAQRADAAQRIVWVRETGQTEEAQLAAAATSGEDANLIRSVYRRSGTAAQIRAAIEAECLADNTPPPRNTSGADSSGGAGAPSGSADAAARPGGDAAARSKRAQCDDLATTLDTLRQVQRQGGGTSVQEGLNRQVRESQQRMRDLGC